MRQEEKQGRTHKLAQDEGMARFYLSLSGAMLDLLHYLTKEVPEPFLVSVRVPASRSHSQGLE